MNEVRRPNVFVSAKIAAATEDKASYIKHRGLDKKHYQALAAQRHFAVRGARSGSHLEVS